jgi:hypothetical protein
MSLGFHRGAAADSSPLPDIYRQSCRFDRSVLAQFFMNHFWQRVKDYLHFTGKFAGYPSAA